MGATDEQVKRAREKWGAQQEAPAVEVARHGLTKRWEHRWSQYAGDRIVSLGTASAHSRDAIVKQVDDSLALAAAEALNMGLQPGPTKNVANVLMQCLAIEPNLEALRANIESTLIESLEWKTKKVSKGNHKTVLQQLNDEPPAALHELIDAVAEAWSPPPHPDGDGLLLGAELSFGRESVASLQLGRAPIAVSGSIDTVVERKSAASTPTLEIFDYKTGKTGGNHKQVKIWFTKPQLSFYALAVRARLVSDLADYPVNRLGYYMVRENMITIPVEASFLDAAEEYFGRLVDRARDGDFVPISHPEWSPYSGGHQNDIFDALRIRPDGLPDHAEETEEQS